MLQETLTKADQDGFVAQRRCLTYAAGLAIKQNDPVFALNIIGG